MTAMKIYQDIDAFIAPSDFLKKKLISNGFKENKLFHIPTFSVGKPGNRRACCWNVRALLWPYYRGKRGWKRLFWRMRNYRTIA